VRLVVWCGLAVRFSGAVWWCGAVSGAVVLLVVRLVVRVAVRLAWCGAVSGAFSGAALFKARPLEGVASLRHGLLKVRPF
jgi:hypothetical protein